MLDSEHFCPNDNGEAEDSVSSDQNNSHNVNLKKPEEIESLQKCLGETIRRLNNIEKEGRGTPEEKLMSLKKQLIEKLRVDHVSNSFIGDDISKWSVARFKGDPPPLQFLVNNYIPADVTGVVHSIGGCGKGTLMLDLSLRIVLAEFNLQWLSSFSIPEPGSVVYLGAEDPDGELHRRFYGLLNVILEDINNDPLDFNDSKSLEISDVRKIVNPNFYIINSHGKQFSLFKSSGDFKPVISASPDYKSLENSIEQLIVNSEKGLCFRPRLLIVDPRSRLSGLEGMGNTVSAKEVGYYDSFSSKFKINVLIVHHDNKASYTGNSNAAMSIRGESGFLDSLRFGLRLSHLSTKQIRNYGILPSESLKYLFIQNSKQNYMPMHNDLIIRRDGYRYNLENLNSSTFLSGKAGKQFRAVNELKEIKTVWPVGEFKTAIMEKCGIKQGTVKDYVIDMVKDGLIKRPSRGVVEIVDPLSFEESDDYYEPDIVESTNNGETFITEEGLNNIIDSV